MSLYVLKFGGTSVATVDRIKHVSQIVQSYVLKGHHVVVVVSAMAGMTNQLLSFAHDISNATPSDEYDVVLSSGEQITAGLTALCLQTLGLKAQSFLAAQVPVLTDDTVMNAVIKDIDVLMLQKCLANGVVPVVAGFQGIHMRDTSWTSYRLTTLGRGGSDTTAVALACALKAKCCYIYTDVEGVYTADPRLVTTSQKLNFIGYDQMLVLAQNGAKVLHDHCVALAKNSNIELCILSSFEDVPGIYTGTYIGAQPKQTTTNPKQAQCTSITHNTNYIKVDLQNNGSVRPQKQDQLQNELFAFGAKHNLEIHGLAVQNEENQASLSFIIKKEAHSRLNALKKEVLSVFAYDTLETDYNIVTLVVVGDCLDTDQKLLALINKTFESHCIPILAMQIEYLKILITVGYEQMPNALILLHDVLFKRA